MLKLHDAREDTAVSRLLRVIEALEVWSASHHYAIEFAAPWRSRGPTAARALEKAAAEAAIRLDSIKDAAGVRAALELIESPEDLAVCASGPLGRLVIALQEQRYVCMVRANDAQTAMRERLAGDVEINLDKRGRRFFERAVGDDEVARLEVALQSPENAQPHRIRQLRDELAARAALVVDARRLAMVDLFEALAKGFCPASIKAYLDVDDYIAPLATMAYYRDEAAVCADLALLADADLALSRPERPGAYLAYALARSSTVDAAEPMDAANVAARITRLRGISADEVRRVADALRSWVTPLAGGLLVTNPDFDPVGAPIAPFFERLLLS